MSEFLWSIDLPSPQEPSDALAELDKPTWGAVRTQPFHPVINPFAVLRTDHFSAFEASAKSALRQMLRALLGLTNALDVANRCNNFTVDHENALSLCREDIASLVQFSEMLILVGKCSPV